MDELRRHAAPLVDRWQRLARGQRVVAITLVVVSVAGSTLLLSRPAENWQPIFDGREFSASEINSIRSAWRQAGLKSFRLDARKLLVPAEDVARYTAALPQLPREDGDSGNKRGQLIAKANLFTSHEQFEQLKENELRETLCRNLKAIPAIADADVIWARGKGRSAFASRPKVTATINVLPREGHELTPELARSLRAAVAGMIPDLDAEDVVVLDQSTGLAMTDASGDLFAEQQHRRQLDRLSHQIESKIAAALAHLPQVAVQVRLVTKPSPPRRHAAAKPVFGSAIMWTTDDPANLVEFSSVTASDGSPSAASTTDSANGFEWQVSVQIPQASFDAYLAQKMLSSDHRTVNLDDLCDAECARLRGHVRHLLPPDAKLAELSIVPQTAPTTTTRPVAGFTAWPHVVCGLLGMLCLTVAGRRRPMDRGRSLADASIEFELRDADAQRIPSAHRADEDRDVVSATNSIVPLTDVARLQQIEPPRLADALRGERPQAIAVLLTRFPTRLVSTCLSQFPSSLQIDVIRRLKSLGKVSDELVAEIAHAVCLRMSLVDSTETREPINRIAHLLPEHPMPRAVE